MERRAERRREWAASREARSERQWETARRLIDPIPLGQPILVGHYSEKRHRRTLDRAASNMAAAVGSAEMAKHHASKASGIEAQLDRSIYSDDADAIEALEARAAEIEARAARMAAVRKATRRAYKAKDAAAMAAALDSLNPTPEERREWLRNIEFCWSHDPMPAYAVSNLRGNLSRIRKRLDGLRVAHEERAKVREALAEESAADWREASGVRFRVLDAGENWCLVAFNEKPPVDVRAALKAAWFRWDSVREAWAGPASRLPEMFKEGARA